MTTSTTGDRARLRCGEIHWNNHWRRDDLILKEWLGDGERKVLALRDARSEVELRKSCERLGAVPAKVRRSSSLPGRAEPSPAEKPYVHCNG